MLVAEHYIEAIAVKLNLDVDYVRKVGRACSLAACLLAPCRTSLTLLDATQINLYQEGQRTHYHQPVLDWHVPRLLEECRTNSEYDRRRAEVDKFNKEHRWRKRGIALLPTKFGVSLLCSGLECSAELTPSR